MDAFVGDERPERGPDLEQVVGETAVVLGLGALASGFLEQRAEFGLDRRDLAFEPGAVLVFVKAVPGLEETARECEPLLAEGLLGRESFRVTTEISVEMTPARLAAGGVDVVVGPPAVGAADAGELVAE